MYLRQSRRLKSSLTDSLQVAETSLSRIPHDCQYTSQPETMLLVLLRTRTQKVSTDLTVTVGLV